MQERCGASIAGRRWWRVGLQPDGQDPFDGAVGGIADRDHLGAGPFEPVSAIPVGQPEHALSGAQPKQCVVAEQVGDDRCGRRTDLAGPVAAPRWTPHGKGDALGRVVRHVGLLAERFTHVGGDQLAGIEDLHHVRCRPHVDFVADVSPRHRVQRSARLDMDVWTYRAPRPVREHKAPARQRNERLGLDRGEY
jgi:hypothetical protein